MTTSTRILVLDHSPALLELSAILLGAEGYDVVTHPVGAASLQTIKDAAPAALVCTLGPVPDGHLSWELLRQVHADPQTRHVGVLVIASYAATLARAIADHTLGASAGLLMPFDIDDFYRQVQATLGRTATAGPDGGPPAGTTAAHALATRRQIILQRWVQRLVTIEPFLHSAVLTAQQAAGDMAALLDALLDALPPPGSTAARPSARDAPATIAQQQWQLRRALGLHPEDLVSAYHALRLEVHQTLREAVEGGHVDPHEAFLAQARLDEAIDECIACSVHAHTT